MFCYICYEVIKMEENLISKKELLDLTGISYGQLYRWKRKQLIPEDWFIKKSSFTGQETFFPKERILARIDKIVNMKDDLSLDDIAVKVSPSPSNISLTKQELLDKQIVTAMNLDFITQNMGEMKSYPFNAVLFMFILDKLFRAGNINLDEGKLVIQVLADNFDKFTDKPCELVFIRKLGISSCLLIQGSNPMYFEKNTNVIFNMNVASCMEELKIKLT